MKKIIFTLSLLLITSFGYSKPAALVPLSNGTYAFISGQGEQLQVTIKGTVAVINLGYGNITATKLVKKIMGTNIIKTAILV
jgi:hypothetical protein